MAAIYKTLASQLEAGRIPNLKETRATAVDRTLKALDANPAWRTFDSQLQVEMAKRQLTQSQMVAALNEIADGLAGDAFLSPEVLEAAVELVQAVIARDRPAMLAAGLKLVLAFIKEV